MQKIIQLSTHVANLIAAGEVVERPASVVKELLENAVDAGATQVTVEIRDGGMTFLRVTDNGCGMNREDARTAFLRHATSKLRNAEDLASIMTMGFRGEALAAIASVSRIELLTKTPGDISGTSLMLEAGNILEESDAGCPDGTTIIVRDLFFNTPARMKFMKADSVEGGKVAAAVQMQALAHPEVSLRFFRDGKQVLSTPGSGLLEDVVYCIYGRDFGRMVKVDSQWDGYTLTGFVSKATDARPSRNMQTFFVNGRPVRSRILIGALEEAYRNQIMAGKFPACVLHLNLPANAVDVNVHPAKTEVKFLNEKAVFDCMHYGVLGALNTASDRPQIQFAKAPVSSPPPVSQPAPAQPVKPAAKQNTFFRTMSAQEYQAFSAAIKDAPQPNKYAAAATVAAVERSAVSDLRENIVLPTAPVQPAPPPVASPIVEEIAPQQQELPMPEVPAWRFVGELYQSYILVEQGEDAFLIDKHAAHERILFNKLKENQEAISAQALVTPIPCQLRPDAAATLLERRELLDSLGFEVDAFGEGKVLLRQIPMDLSAQEAVETLEALAADLMSGSQKSKDDVRDEVLHTVACKAAIKAGWRSDEKELMKLAEQVMSDPLLKHCPHGRPICISLSKKQLEKQFKRT